MFHVGLLKEFHGEPPLRPGMLPPTKNDRVCPVPVCSDQEMVGRWPRGVNELLVHWQGQTAADATWVPLLTFCKQYLDFQLEGELIVQGAEMSCGVSHTNGARRHQISRDKSAFGLGLDFNSV